jgi:Ser/Thr protein kinase RdoA (MazF antagonist)
MGAIHRVTSELQLKNAKYRKYWDKEVIIERADELLPNEDNVILKNLKQILGIVNTFSKNKNSFGLTHTDMRPRNFAYTNGIITHFDFDDICHHWFMYDIAVSVYHEIESINDLDERTRFAINFLKDLTDGYMKERRLSIQDLLQI